MSVVKFTNRPKSFKEMPAVLNMSEACCLLGCTDETVSKMIRHGKIKGNKDGKQWFISKASIEAFVNGEAS